MGLGSTTTECVGDEAGNHLGIIVNGAPKNTFTYDQRNRLVNGPHGGTITDGQANTIETGGVDAPAPTEVFRPGDTIPDYELAPPNGLHIEGNPITVDTPTRLSDLLQENMGICHWAACRSMG